MIRGAKEGCVVEFRVERCDIVCAAEVRGCVECVGGSDECIELTRWVVGVRAARRRRISKGKRSVGWLTYGSTKVSNCPAMY